MHERAVLLARCASGKLHLRVAHVVVAASADSDKMSAGRRADAEVRWPLLKSISCHVQQ